MLLLIGGFLKFLKTGPSPWGLWGFLLILLLFACEGLGVPTPRGSGEIRVSNHAVLFQGSPSSLEEGEGQQEEGFYIHKMVEVRIIAPGEFLISNYSPGEFQDLELWHTPTESSPLQQGTLLGVLPFLPPFSQLTVESDWVIRRGSLQVSSEDPTFKQLSQILPRWYLSFRDLNPNQEENGYWEKTLPIHIRKYSPAMANAASVLSSDLFRKMLLVYPGELYGNDGPGNPVDREALYEQLLELSGIRLGVVDSTSNIIGLGGQQILGVRESSLDSIYDRKILSTAVSTIGHELGHSLDYTHSSNIASSAQESFGTLFLNVWLELYDLKELPFMEKPF